MPWIKTLISSWKWLLALGLFAAFIFVDQQVQSLKQQLQTAKAQVETKELQYQTAQTFNDSLNATIVEMSKHTADSYAAEDWMRKFNAAMAANLDRAKRDIGKLINEQAKDANSCSGSFSPAVYERMLDVYRNGTTGAEGDNSG